jgi:hypothetical protein
LNVELSLFVVRCSLFADRCFVRCSLFVVHCNNKH